MDITDPHDPTARAVRELITLDGGPLVPGALGRTLRNEHFMNTVVSLDYLGETLNRVSVRNGGPAVSVHVTRSPSMGASVRPVGNEHAAVLVPVGTLARLEVVNRLLLGYWQVERQVPRVMGTLLDRPFERRIPPALVPLLRDQSDEAEWWERLDALNASIDLDARFHGDVAELNHLALSLLLGHEFAHAVRRHADVRRRVRAGELAFEVGENDRHAVFVGERGRRAATDAELGRAMENDADRVAVYLAVWRMLKQTEDHPEARPLGFVRLGYAVTALLALFDPDKLSLMHFSGGSAYPHPIIRHTSYLQHITVWATSLGLPEQFVKVNLNYGVDKAFNALDQLEFDILAKRRFCEADGPVDSVVHALRPSRAAAIRLALEGTADDIRLDRLNTLITEAYGEFIVT